MAHETEIDSIMNGEPFTHRQARYWKKILDDFRMKGISLGYHKEEIWKNAIADPSSWQPGLHTFLPRVRLGAKLLKKGEMPKSPTDADRIIKPTQSPAMMCMIRGCAEGRSRPFVHEMRWWEPGRSDSLFGPLWAFLSPRLKSIYTHPIWKKRIEEYGLYVCWNHYRQAYRVSFPSQEKPIPKASWFPQSRGGTQKK